jgi:VIT1/CCC1 family predicted Fe2+/Mn2+ transporter
MSDRVTLGVQFDPDSDLLEEFEEYKEEHEFASSAETLRHLMRKELEGGDTTAPEREELRRELRKAQREAQYGAWETGALSSATLLAALAISVAVSTILPVVPSFEGIATASLLLATAVGLVAIVFRGTVGRLERRFSTPHATAAELQGVSE